jgi:hypothetical protein
LARTLIYQRDRVGFAGSIPALQISYGNLVT